MKVRHKYIHFEESCSAGFWSCLSNKDNFELGRISWYPAWRQYEIHFDPNAVFNNSCMRDIADFLEQLNKERPNPFLPVADEVPGG